MSCKRLKTLIYYLLMAVFAGGSPVLAAGTTPLSLVQQFDSTGAPLAGGQLYFFVAGTVATPQNAFADFGLTTPLSNPLTLDAGGRVPQHWLADGLIHIRLTDAAGLVYVDTTMQVLGPSSGGGGGGGTVDPTTILAPGDFKWRYGSGPLAGFVRANGLTIGNAVSGATERANADTQALFIYLYGADPNLVVVGGRSGNALNDYNAGKSITMPDVRGRALAGLDDMGNSPSGRLTSTYFGIAATTTGAVGGSQSHTLAASEIPSITTNDSVASSSNQFAQFGASSQTTCNSAGGGVCGTGTGGLTNGAFVTSTGTGTSNNTGGQPHSVVSPMMVTTLYMKL